MKYFDTASKEQKEVSYDLIKLILNANKFIFLFNYLGAPIKKSEVDEAKYINSPFDLCWFEGGAENGLTSFSVGDKKFFCVGALVDQRNGRNDCFFLGSVAEKNEEVLQVSPSRPLFFIKGSQPYKDIMSVFLDKMSGYTHTVSMRSQQKITLDGKKYKYRIGKVVYVSPKKIDASCSFTHKKIEWSHKWEVRGHWRKCACMGKDRQGEYISFNRTWVLHHTRGEGDLVKKLRVFKGENKSLQNV